MVRKFLVFTLLFCITLAGCGGSDTPGDSPSDASGITTLSPVDISGTGSEPSDGNSDAGSASSDDASGTGNASSNNASGADSEPSDGSSDTDSTSSGDASETGSADPDGGSGAPISPDSAQTATIYVGTRAAGFTLYPLTYEGTLTPEILIQGIQDLTGWNLTLAESVISGRGGMSVCLSEESSLFTGPPDPQKDEFHVYDGEQLAEMILDSIQKTLQNGFTGEGGDPEALDIWYYMQDNHPLTLPNLGLSWPIDQPYQWTGAVRD